MERYKRQLDLIGADGQEKLKNAKVLVVGAGGLGNICAKFLASSGVGKITICDNDAVELSNLNRQILFNDESIGMNKAKALVVTLGKINPEIDTSWFDARIQDWDFLKILLKNNEYDVIVDCTDNMETSYYLEEQALKTGIPFIFAKTSKWFGVVGVIKDKPYIEKSYPKKQLNKNNAVFPPIGGVIGSLQAGFAIKLILGLDVDEDLMYYDFLNNVTTKIKR